MKVSDTRAGSAPGPRFLDITGSPSASGIAMTDSEGGPGTWAMRDDLGTLRIADGSMIFPVFRLFMGPAFDYACRRSAPRRMLCRVRAAESSDVWYVTFDQVLLRSPLDAVRDEPAANRPDSLSAAPKKGPWANAATAFKTAKSPVAGDVAGRWSRAMDTRGPGGGGPAWLEIRLHGKSGKIIGLMTMVDPAGSDIGFRGTEGAVLAEGVLSFLAAPLFSEMEWGHACKLLEPGRLLCRVNSKFARTPWFVGFERSNAERPRPRTQDAAPGDRRSASDRPALDVSEADRRAATKLWNEGILLFQRGDKTGAKKAWEECLALDPANADCPAGIQKYLR